jgi:predicted phosphodiesterase
VPEGLNLSRLVVLSDVHGNLPALQAVIEDLEGMEQDGCLFAGDFTRGPFPNEVIDLLRTLDACMILGNDDQGLLHFAGGDVPEVWMQSKQFGLMRWNLEQLRVENLEFLKSLPEQRVYIPGIGDPIRIVHGSPRDASEAINPARSFSVLDKAFEMIAEKVLISGHTHRQWSLQRKGKLGLNPGSVAGTRTGGRAEYALLSSDDSGLQVELRSVPYDLKQLRQAFEDRGLLEAGGPLAKGFLLSMETGHDYMVGFLHHAHHLKRHAGFPEGEFIPDDVWDAACKTYQWVRPSSST